MKKKIAIAVTVIILIMIAILASTDIWKSAPNKTDTCFIVGNTKNVKPLDNNLLSKEIQNALENSSEYSIIVADGNPNEISKCGTMILPTRLFEAEKNNQIIINKYLTEIMSCEPNDEEIDILAAISAAANTIDRNADNKRIIIYSAGISTSGHLNFVENPNLIYEDPQEIIELLKMREALPDLSDIEIVWYGLNHVNDEQKELGTFELYKLKCIWTEVLKACNVEVENFDDIFDETPPQSSDENIIDKSSFPNVSSAIFDNIFFSLEEFNFIANTTILKNEQRTIDILIPIADDIINAGCPSFYVVGSTASIDTNEECLTLSIERAEVIKELLCDLGVPSSCLSVMGIGKENIDGKYGWRVDDLNSDNSLNKESALKNRKVMLISVESETGKRFKNDYSNYFSKD